MRLLPILLTALVLLPAELRAETAEEKGLAIAMETDRLDTGWGDQRARMIMTLRNSQGQETSREIRSSTLEVTGDGDKTLIVFDQPKDVSGTAFLSHTHAVRPDDQWLYLPALKRVKRISSANKSGPFMGSEFAYEDIASQEVAKYTYKYMRDEVIDGAGAYVIERYPSYEKSGYVRQIVWIDQGHFQPLRIDFYDRKDTLLKTLGFRGYQQYLDKYWRAGEMEMVNHQTGKSTLLQWLDYQFANGFTDRDFDENSLKRAR